MWWGDEDILDDKAETRLGASALVKSFAPYFWSQRYRFGLAFLLLIFTTAAALAGPQILRLSVDAAVAKKPAEDLIRLAVIFIVISVAGFALDFALTLTMARSGLTVTSELKERLFSHILKLPVSFFHEYTPGRLLSRVESDCESLKQLFSHASVRMFTSCLMFIGVLGLMIYEDRRVTQVLVIAFPIVAVFATVAMIYIRRYYRDSRKASAQISSFIAEYLPGIETVQHYNYQNASKAKLEALNDRLVKAHLKAEILSYSLWAVLFFLEVLAIIALVSFAWPKIINKTMPLGTLVLFIEYIRKVFQPLGAMAEFANFIQRGFVSGERVFALLALTSEYSERGNEPVPDEINTLEFDNVSFSYGEETVLHELTFKLARGQKVALVGPSGGGKSTIANLFMSFYRPSTGEVKLNSRDLKSFDLGAYRRRIGIVLQELKLFPGTVRQNLTVFQDSITDAQINNALKAAQCEELVSKLGGLDAVIAEGGRDLSHGERQLLSIARALIQNPTFVILDEATASVDPLTERNIQRSMDLLMEGRTSLVIAHRLSTIVDADQIFVIQNGHIVARGTHTELLNSDNEIYRNLHKHQSGE